jgi:gliding motility-associated-like protein
MKRFILLLLFCASAVVTKGQSFYICEGYDLNDDWHIRRVTLTSAGYQSTLIDLGPYPDKIFSIAAQGKYLYYFSQNSELVKAEISGDKLINYETLLPLGVYANNLTIAKDGSLYWYTDALYKYDQVLQKVFNLGPAPYSPSGDLMFYKDDLYMAAFDGIIKVDLNDLAKSSIYISIPYNYYIYGLAGFPVNPTQNKYIALSVSGRNTNIMELDMENRTFLPSSGTIPFSVLDAGSEVEDGTFTNIEINKIQQFADCNNSGKGVIKVQTKPHTASYTYELKGKLNNITQSNTTGIFTNLSPDNYTLKITSPNESVTRNFVVTQFISPKPVINLTKKNPVCDILGEIHFNMNGGGEVYKIKYGNNVYTSTSQSFTNLGPGTYHFDILNELDCPVDIFDVTLIRDKCTVKFDKLVIQPECNIIGKGSVQVLTNAHTDVYTYTLNNTVTNTTGVFNLLSPGTYTVKITSAEDEKIITADVPDYTLNKPQVSYAATNPVCDATGKIAFNISNAGTEVYKIKYLDNLYATNITLTGLTTGLHHFEVYNSNNCIVDAFNVQLGRDKCTIDYTGLQIMQECGAIKRGNIKVLTNPHADIYTYTLNNIRTNTTGLFDLLPPGTYNIHITSAEDEKDVIAVVPDYSLTDPVATMQKINPFCAKKGLVKFSIPLSNSDYQVKYAGNTYPLSNSFDNLDAGHYEFVLLKPGNCVLDSISVDLVYEPCVIEVESSSVNQECEVLGKGVIKVVGKPIPEIYTYQLNTGEVNHTGVFNMLNPGNYSVLISASGGNTPQQVYLTVPDYNLTKPSYVISNQNPVCDLLGTIKLKVTTDPNLYNIKFNGAIYPYDYTFERLPAGTYYFKIIKKDGCIANELSLFLKQENCNLVTFPNTFTPNSDGINDIFRPNPESRASQYQLQIFNRYGTLIFMTKDSNNGWDGTNEGKKMPIGTYYWVATFVDINKKFVTQRGPVTILR